MNLADTDVRGLVAAEVRAELARQRISIRQAAFRLGWGQATAYRRLTGEAALDAGHLHQLAQLLGVPVATFFETAGVRCPGILPPAQYRASGPVRWAA